MMTDRSPDVVFSASEVQNHHKKKAWDNGGVRERDHSVYNVETLLAIAMHSPPPWLCVIHVDRRSREQSIGSPFHFGHLRRALSPSQELLSCVSERCSLCTRAGDGIAS